MRMYVSIPDHLLRAADFAARLKGLSRSAYIRNLISTDVERVRKVYPDAPGAELLQHPKPPKPETPAQRERRVLAELETGTWRDPAEAAGRESTSAAYYEQGRQAALANDPPWAPDEVPAGQPVQDWIAGYQSAAPPLGRAARPPALYLPDSTPWEVGVQDATAGRPAACPGHIEETAEYFAGHREGLEALEEGRSDPDGEAPQAPLLAAAWAEGRNAGIVERSPFSVPAAPETPLPHSAWQRLWIEGREAAGAGQAPDCPHEGDSADAWWAGYKSKEG